MLTIIVLSNNDVGVVLEKKGVLVKVRLIKQDGTFGEERWYHSCQVKAW